MPIGIFGGIPGSGRRRRGGGGAPPPPPPPFVPTDLAGLQLYLRGDQGITLNGATVSAWADQSGAANHASQGTGASQPTYQAASAINSQGAILGALGKSLDVAHAAALAPANLSVFCVVRPTSHAAYASILMKASSSGWSDGFGIGNADGGTGGTYGAWIGNYTGHAVSTTLALNTSYILSMVYDGTTLELFKNGVSQGTHAWGGPINYSSTPTLQVGTGRGGSYNFRGPIAALLFYNRALDATERGQVRDFLAGLYGITV